MYDKFTNSGLLFNHLPKLVLIATKAIKSESDLLVKLAREVKNDPNITHDHQFFRQFRAEGLDIDKFAKYFGQKYVLQTQEQLSEVNPDHLGAWFQVKQIVKGFKQSFDPTNALGSYWLFLESHTEVEHSFIKKNYGKDSFDQIIAYLNDWLLVDRFCPTKPTTLQSTQYLIHMVMYWGALYELLLEEYSGSVEHSILKKCLPLVDKKKKFVYSSGIFLNNVKRGWAKEQYSKENIQWTVLQRDIIQSQRNDPDLVGRLSEISIYDDIDPDLTAIKQRFTRWRKGDFLSIDDVRTNIAVLRSTYKQTENILTLDIIIFINLFTHIQKELLSSGASEQTIVDTFERYAEFKSIVERRYSNFKCTGNLVN